MKLPKLNKYKGLTLIELTIVVVVLLGLVSILFFGARAFLIGANRTRCIANQRGAHQAARSYQNLENLKIGDAYDPANLIGQGNFLITEPTCPSNGTYTWAATIPDFGSLFLSCSLADDEDLVHIPQGDIDW